MAMKAGLGRLTLSGRREYQVTPYYRDGVRVAYAVICSCIAGNHHLSPDGEHVVGDGAPLFAYPTYADAEAAIQAWQRQHDAAQAASGETQEG